MSKTKKTGILIFSILYLFLVSCNKDISINIESFKIIKDNEIIETTDSSAVISGSYAFLGTIDNLKLQTSNTIAFNSINEHNGEIVQANYRFQVPNLRPNTVYYYRYKVSFNEKENLLTEIDSFTTQKALPVIQTLSVTSIDSVSVRVKGSVLSDGGTPIIDCGICWSRFPDPTLDDDAIPYTNPSIGEYTCIISNLAESTDYYARAYAKNDAGIGYGNVVSFRTGDTSALPTVITINIDNITMTTAVCHCVVSSVGGSEVSERGVCWGVNENPNLTNSHASSGSGVGNYEVLMSDLLPKTIYYVRAYAINNSGTSFGDPLSFSTTDGRPKVTTGEVTQITGTTAVCSGTVTDQGGSSVTERGICYGQQNEPSITNSPFISCGSGIGTFSETMKNLTTGRTYYVRAYAFNSFGISYGEPREFVPRDGLPVVETLDITEITDTSAIVGGNVIDDGGFVITERGICWSSTEEYPTIENEHNHSGTGTGAYTILLSSLVPGTRYFARAYATNDNGTTYGNPKPFNTNVNLPTVETVSVHHITHSTAICKGSVIDEGGSTVTERGVCWGEQPNPNINNQHASSNSGTGDYEVQLSGLSPNTVYYVRAYAKNSQGFNYGDDLSFLTQIPPQAPEGAINGLFSIGENKKAWFSQGNLKYNANTNTWRFSDHQYDMVGESNVNISSTYSGWIDLFGWATSGYNHNNACFQPWSNNNNPSKYYAYNHPDRHLFEETGTADWGYNKISNGGNMDNQWRTPKTEEWVYLFNRRETISGYCNRYAKACVNGINGVILFPDDWNPAEFAINHYDEPNAPFSSNNIQLSDWNNHLESKGVVFLPVAGIRQNDNATTYNSSTSYYWSASSGHVASCYALKFQDDALDPGNFLRRCYGLSVRLIHDF